MNRSKRDIIVGIGTIWIFGILALAMGYRPDLLILAVYTAVMMGAFIFSPPLGLAAFIMVIPFEMHLADELPFSAFYALIPGMILGYFVYCVKSGRTVPFEKEGVWFSVALIIVAIASFGGSDFPPQYRVFASLILMILTFLISSSILRHDRESVYLVGHGLIAASAIGGMGGLVYMGASEYEVVQEIGSRGRISIGGNVRAVGNVIGLSLFFLIGSALLKRADIMEFSRKQRFFPLERSIIVRSLLIILFGLFIAASALRGMIVAVAAGVIVLMIMAMVFGGIREKRFRLSFWALPVTAMAIYGAIVITMTYVDPQILGGQLGARMDQFIQDPLSNPRIWIWQGTLEQLVGAEWILGTGLGTFRWMAANAGIYFYAHSVFVDILVEMGVLGLFTLLTFLGYLGIRLYKTKNVFGIGFLAFLVVSFSTYGSSSTKAFWITLGLVYGVASLKEFGVRPREVRRPQREKRPERELAALRY